MSQGRKKGTNNNKAFYMKREREKGQRETNYYMEMESSREPHTLTHTHTSRIGAKVPRNLNDTFLTLARSLSSIRLKVRKEKS
jgi:hypothetical protein